MAKTEEYGFGEYTFPRGWFVVADSATVTKSPCSVRFFANDMVLYRGESGRVVMLDAYCPHMKTHLGCNTTSFVVTEGRHVEGDSIRCPYHAWRFGPDGKCDDIPYFDNIPTGARVRSWQVREAQGMVFVWHDPEGHEPDYDLPALPEWDDPAWIRWTVSDYGTMNTHPVEFLDNLADIAHLSPIHGTIALRLENEISGPYASQRSSQYLCNAATTDPSYQGNTYYTGPSIVTTRSLHSNGNRMIERICHTPVDDGVSQVWHAIMIKSPHDVATDEDIATLGPIAEAFKGGFAQDFEIWANKAPCIQPMQLPTDGSFRKVRQWYRQYYSPRAKSREVLTGIEGVYTVPGFPGMPVNELDPWLQDADTVKYCHS